ncbi:MAG: starch-binding outer membrane lipoprotein SusD, partial [Bacteroidaceae bacterium]|nr:starch-binding outer membrane lipoprotein SusD [Bacteroidaceae bacterium]
MKFRYFKNVIPAAVVSLLVAGGVSSCTKDLDQSIQDPQTNTQFNATGLLAKIYANLTITGTIGGSGNADMSQFDEGNSSMYRRIFEANELCSDECIWTWQGDAGIPELTNISWNSSHGYNELTYYRLMYNITLCNFYLDQTEGTEDAQM